MARSSRVLLLLVGLLVTVPSLIAESKLIFPRIVFQAGRYSGMAIANPTATDADVTLTAFRTDGTLLSGPGLTNPRHLTVSAGSQYSKLVTEIFTPPSSIVDSPDLITAWVEVSSPVDGLTGFFLDFNGAVDFLDGSDLSGTGTDTVVPFIENSGSSTTELSIVNADPSVATDLVAELVDGGGNVLATHSKQLQPRVALQAPAAQLFPGDYTNVRTLRLRSTHPLACMAFIFRRSDNSLVVIAAQNAGTPVRRINFPQLAQGGDWATSVGLVNLGSSGILVTLTALKPDGTLYSAPDVAENPVARTLSPGASLKEDARSLFGFPDSPLRVGWIKAEATEPAINGFVEYGAGSNRALVSAQLEPVTRAIFSHQANGAGFYTGLAVLNPGNLTANIEITALDADSKVLGKTSRVLRPGQREAILIPQWIAGAASAVGGSIFLKSSVPIIATQLFGTETFTALSNVPPQALTTGFDPGASLPTLQVSPPLAVVETGKTRQFNTSGPAIGAWSVNGIGGGNSSDGTISGAGLYTAPPLAPSQHNQAVGAATAIGDQSAAASLDVVQRESLTTGLTLLTAVAYFTDLQRFFIAEQQILSSAPNGRVYAAGPNTRISEVAPAGSAQSFFTITGDTIAKMIGFRDASGNSHLLLAGKDTGTIYRLSIATKALTAIATGLNQPNSLALDPVSGNLFVSEGGSNQVTVIERSRFEPSSAAPAAAPAYSPQPVRLAVATPAGIAFDPCAGALYVSSSDGSIREYLGNRERVVISGRAPLGQILILLRQGVPSCHDAVSLFVSENSRVLQVDPRSGDVISFLDSTNEVQDLGFLDKLSPFSPRREESILIGEGPPGTAQSRVLVVAVGGLYAAEADEGGLYEGGVSGNSFSPPGNSGIPGSQTEPGPEYTTAGGTIVYRDRTGDTFATIKTRVAGLYAPDIAAISIHKVGNDSVVSVTFTQAVAPALQNTKNSLSGFIDFDTRRGSGVASHADSFRLLRPSLPETDAYVDLSTGTIFLLSAAAPAFPSEAVQQLPVSIAYLGKTVSVVIPGSLFDATKARINVTAANAVEVTDIAPESIYAFVNLNFSPLPTVQFASSNSSGAESLGQVTIPVTLSVASGSTVTVNYAATGGTAASGADYTLASGTLTFSPGEVNRSISFSVSNDSVDEPDETVVISLSQPNNAALGTISTHAYTILDDDSPTPRVQFVSAGSSGAESVGQVSIPVTLSVASISTVTVNFSATGGTATNSTVRGDYLLTPGTLSFAPGETSKTIVFPVFEDTLVEGNETIVLALSNPSGAVLGGITGHTYTIVDNDVPLPVVEFATGTSNGSEAVSSTKLVVGLSSVSKSTVTVDYAVTGGTATSGAAGRTGDYLLAAGTLSFPAGTTSDAIVLTIINDSLDEPDETVQVTLSNPVGATLGKISTHTYTILDDDAPDLLVSVPPTILRGSTVSPGGSVLLSGWTVQNAGNVTAGAFSNGFYLSTDAVITTGDIFLDGNSNSSLGPSQSFAWGGPTLTIPQNTPPGNYYIGVLVDLGNSVPESNESNNYASVPIIVK